jgi:hypothetical protein
MPFVAGRRGIIMAHTDIGGNGIMTTPNGSPTGANPARPRGYSSTDADAQASPVGGGQFTGGSEAKVMGSNQDKSPTGAADASSEMALIRKNIANPPGTAAQFTAED